MMHGNVRKLQKPQEQDCCAAEFSYVFIGHVGLFQFSHLGQLIVIVPPANCMGGAYRDNSHSEQSHKTCVPLLECRFHVRLSFDLGARYRSHAPVC